jgi:Zn-dependent M28 family amino/carboxypeptidase
MRKQFYFLFLLSFLIQLGAVAQKIDKQKLLHDIAYLASDELEGRKPLSEGSIKARNYIRERFQSLGLTSQYTGHIQTFDFYNQRENRQYQEASNVVGFIPGSQKDDIIVIMAHYDHLGRQGDLIYNGADDNASGTAAVLAIAEYFSKNRPRHSMMFVALDAEEMGHQGAKALVADFPFPLTQVVLNVNMDMVSRNVDNELYASGTYHYPHLKPLLLKAAEKQEKIALKFGHDVPGTGRNDWTLASDHAQFHLNKIPFIYFGVEDHKDYHKPSDTYDNIHPDFFHSSVELITAFIIIADEGL